MEDFVNNVVAESKENPSQKELSLQPLMDGDTLLKIKEKLSGIYRITSPSGKIYIGQSTDLRKRLVMYRGLQCKQQRKLYNSFLKYGVENHKFEVICICETSEQLNAQEAYYVEIHNSFNSDIGLNLKAGGGNSVKYSEETRKLMSDKLRTRKVSESTRKKMSERMKKQKMTPEKQAKMIAASKAAREGKPLSLDHKQKLRDILTGRKMPPSHSEMLRERNRRRGALSQEVKDKISNSNKGRTVTPETREKLRIAQLKIDRKGEKNAMWGKTWSDERKKAHSDKIKAKHLEKCKYVCQISLDGFLIDVFCSIKQAQEVTGASSIGNVLHGRTKKSGGYYWK